MSVEFQVCCAWHQGQEHGNVMMFSASHDGLINAIGWSAYDRSGKALPNRTR
jgi:hypothetical protein